MYMYDSIIVASGLNDILEGRNGYAVFESLLKISSVVKVIETECHVLQLSLVSNTDKYTDTVINNCQIEDEACIKHISIIMVLDRYPKSLLLQDDGVRLQAVAKVIMGCINPEKKSKKPFHEMDLGNIKPNKSTQPPFSAIKPSQSSLSTRVAPTKRLVSSETNFTIQDFIKIDPILN